MTEMTPEEEEQLEVVLQRSIDNPMPPALHDAVENAIVPHTLNASLKHGEVMIAIEIAYPLIRDYLREHDTPATG